MKNKEGTRTIHIVSGTLEKIAAMGLEPTEEMLAFVDKIVEDAHVGGELSKPYVDAGAIVVKKTFVANLGTFTGIYVDDKKFGEMVRNPKTHSA